MESKHLPGIGSCLFFRFILLLMLLAFGNKFGYANNPHHYDRTISEIRVYGNEKTQSRFILKWADLRPGELLTREKIKLARQNILDTSLFKEVTIKLKQLRIRSGSQSTLKRNVSRCYCRDWVETLTVTLKPGSSCVCIILRVLIKRSICWLSRLT